MNRGKLEAVKQEASQVVQAVKNPPANAGDIREQGSIPGSGMSPEGGHGNPLQYSCLENPIDRGARGAAIHGSRKELDMTGPTEHKQELARVNIYVLGISEQNGWGWVILIQMTILSATVVKNPLEEQEEPS